MRERSKERARKKGRKRQRQREGGRDNGRQEGGRRWREGLSGCLPRHIFKSSVIELEGSLASMWSKPVLSHRYECIFYS